MRLLQACFLLAASAAACGVSWHKIQAHGRTTAAVVVTACCTYYAAQLERSTPTVVEVVSVNEPVEPADSVDEVRPRQLDPLSDDSLKRIARMLGEQSMQIHFQETLDAICVQRQPGTPSHAKVREFIESELNSLGWTVDEDSFTDDAPHGRKPFTNIVATLDPHACHRLVLACHYDSKVLDNFVGAIDSAVPCSQMINLVKVLNEELQAHKKRGTGLTLQLLFFDGEEAFFEWTDSDSLYGSRHLAKKWNVTKFLQADGNRCRPSSDKNIISELDRIDLFILLDLLGAENPKLWNFFDETVDFYDQFTNIERRLNKLGLMEGRTKYFTGQTRYLNPGDDHKPFQEKDVPVVHLIPMPFPKVWHKASDTKENLHRPTIRNLNKIFAAFLAWYMEL